MTIYLYNTLSHKKEEFTPLSDKEVRMYVCGVTPYDTTHLGHGRCYVAFDVIRRYLEFRGYKVKYIQNFTDVDDKIINRAKELNIPPQDLAQRYIREYFTMMDKLNIKRADQYPLVTEHIPEIINFVETLVKKGSAYAVEGNVYFSVNKFPNYGKLSRRNLDELLAGARIEVDTRKKDPLDFALWKSVPADTGEIDWDSPWGRGRPGWHIECSAMATKYLGESFDIHGGGADLIFPHHENEIAQSESFSGKPFARYWLHNGFVTIKQDKMSKSLGNFFTLEQIYSQASPVVVRFFLISQHYRSPLDFSLHRLEEAKQGWQRISAAEKNANFVIEKLAWGKDISPASTEEILNIKNKFYTAMDDDFNTALAIGEMFNLVGELNHYTTQASPPLEKIKGALNLLAEFKAILGLAISEEAKELGKNKIEELIKNRAAARQQKDWVKADQLRQELEKMGLTLEDTPFGTRWQKR